MDNSLETPRLILRRLTVNDIDCLVALDRDPEVMRFITGGIPSSYEAISAKFLPYAMSYNGGADNLGFWAVIEKFSDEFVGWIFLRPESDFELLQQLNLAEADALELGYRLRKTSWGKGYTTEAALLLVGKVLAELETAIVNAWALAENRASIAVMKKVGLRREQEYVFRAELLNNTNLLENPLVQNLLDRTIVKYQLRQTAS